MTREEMRACTKRIIKCRKEILNDYPFFGRLLLRLNIAFAECGTAYTDAQKIVFDIAFVGRLSDKELKFLLLHELLHVVLKHCFRGRNLNPDIYNIACDIVVNSCVLNLMNINKFRIDGSEVMHTAPDGTEGREYSAERVYKMLSGNYCSISIDSHLNIIDCHSKWNDIKNTASEENKWNNYQKEALSSCNKHISGSWFERIVGSINYNSKIDWRIVLHDFLQHTRHDFSFLKPDTRYSEDFILPGFCESAEDIEAQNVWILIDTSGSVDDSGIAIALLEIQSAIEQANIKGYISFFDEDVSEPVSFTSTEDIEKLTVVGGGGTDFCNIFESVNKYFTQPPRAIIILTDGYARFPVEQEIPTIWIMINSGRKSPWGETIHVNSDN